MWRAPVFYEKDFFEKEIVISHLVFYDVSIWVKCEIRMFQL